MECGPEASRLEKKKKKKKKKRGGGHVALVVGEGEIGRSGSEEAQGSARLLISSDLWGGPTNAAPHLHLLHVIALPNIYYCCCCSSSSSSSSSSSAAHSLRSLLRLFLNPNPLCRGQLD
uniref:Uncharacterized protein n=1 Tax=Oryza brachyantha TaxID=4533 RepID=J3MPG3_ORYBR